MSHTDSGFRREQANLPINTDARVRPLPSVAPFRGRRYVYVRGQMRRLLAMLLISASLGAKAEVSYRDSDFSLALGGDWVQLRLLFAEHVVFRSESFGVHVKIMGITEPVRPERTRLVATKLLEETIRREIASAKPGVAVTITEQRVSDIEGGTSATYRGFDSSGRSFITVQRIRPAKSVMMFFEGPIAKAENLDRAVDDVLRGLSQ